MKRGKLPHNTAGTAGTGADAGLLYRFGDLALDTGRRELRRGAEFVATEPQVFDLLVFLVTNRDRVVSKEDLLASVWGGRIVSESTLDSRINATRRAIGDSGRDQRLIRTIVGKGVRFVGVVQEQPAVSETGQVRETATPRGHGWRYPCDATPVDPLNVPWQRDGSLPTDETS